jgi:predicted outer membrane repeat protein
MFNLNGAATLTGCTFAHNTANGASGGAIHHDGGDVGRDLTVIDCAFEENGAVFGGAIHAGNAFNVRFVRCVLLNNVARAAGGGIHGGGNVTDLINCVLAGNRVVGKKPEFGDRALTGIDPPIAGGGGGVFATGGTHHYVNCLFTGNLAGQGGAVHRGARTTATHCTLSGNVALSQGGGIYFDAPRSDASGELLLANAVLWGNLNGQGPESAQFHIASGKVTASHSCLQDEDPDDAFIFPGPGNIDDDPSFVDAHGTDGTPGTLDDDLRLAIDSPCIDTGDNARVTPDIADLDGDGDTTEPTPLDLDDSARIQSVAVDMGAYEALPRTEDSE